MSPIMTVARPAVNPFAGYALQAFQLALSTTHRSVLNGGAFVNNEHITVYFVRLPQRIPTEQFVLQESEVRPSVTASTFLQLTF
jgi:hypothetical protein